MNKKLLAVAVSSALAGIATAHADTANVNVYGKLYPEFAIEKTSGATAVGSAVSTITDPADVTGVDLPSSHFITSSNSNIGFRGDADIGGGMKGWFQVEQSVELTTGEGTFSSRNSAVGLEGGFGNVFLGNWDTVYKQLGGPVGMLGLSSGNFVSSSNILSRFGFGDSRDGRFHERLAGIEYDSPNIGGLQFLIGYYPDEKTDTTDKNVMSIGVKWESGPLYVALGHEVHEDFFALGGNGASSEDTATRLSVAYEIGKTSVGLDWSTLEWEESGIAGAGILSNYDKDTWELSVEHKIGKWGLSASFVNSDEGSCTLTGGVACSTVGLDATQLNLAALYSFNKRVGVFFLYSMLDNGESANHNNTDLDDRGNTGVPAGADTKAMAAGILLRF